MYRNDDWRGRTGVRRGSVLLEVDGRPLKGLDLPRYVSLFRLTALAHQETPTPQDHHRTLGIALL